MSGPVLTDGFCLFFLALGGTDLSCHFFDVSRFSLPVFFWDHGMKVLRRKRSAERGSHVPIDAMHFRTQLNGCIREHGASLRLQRFAHSAAQVATGQKKLQRPVQILLGRNIQSFGYGFEGGTSGVLAFQSEQSYVFFGQIHGSAVFTGSPKKLH